MHQARCVKHLARSIRDLLIGKKATDPSINVGFADEQITAVCMAASEQALADAKRRLAQTSIHALQVLENMEKTTCVANAVSALVFCLPSSPPPHTYYYYYYNYNYNYNHNYYYYFYCYYYYCYYDDDYYYYYYN